MDCKKIRKNIIAYIEDSLNEEDKNSFIRHISNCNSCKLLVEKFSESYNFSNLKASKIDDPYFYTRLLQKLENKPNKSYFSIIMNRVLQPVLISALILLGIYFGNYLGNYYHTYQFSNYNETRKNQINAYAEDNYIILAENESLENFLISNK